MNINLSSSIYSSDPTRKELVFSSRGQQEYLQVKTKLKLWEGFINWIARPFDKNKWVKLTISQEQQVYARIDKVAKKLNLGSSEINRLARNHQLLQEFDKSITSRCENKIKLIELQKEQKRLSDLVTKCKQNGAKEEEQSSQLEIEIIRENDTDQENKRSALKEVEKMTLSECAQADFKYYKPKLKECKEEVLQLIKQHGKPFEWKIKSILHDQNKLSQIKQAFHDLSEISSNNINMQLQKFILFTYSLLEGEIKDWDIPLISQEETLEDVKGQTTLHFLIQSIKFIKKTDPNLFTALYQAISKISRYSHTDHLIFPLAEEEDNCFAEIRTTFFQVFKDNLVEKSTTN